MPLPLLLRNIYVIMMAMEIQYCVVLAAIAVKPLSAISIGRPLMTNAQKERHIGVQGRIWQQSFRVLQARFLTR